MVVFVVWFLWYLLIMNVFNPSTDCIVYPMYTTDTARQPYNAVHMHCLSKFIVRKEVVGQNVQTLNN